MKIYIGNSFDYRIERELIDKYSRYRFIYYKEYMSGRIKYPLHLSMIDAGDISVKKNVIYERVFNEYNEGIKKIGGGLKLQFENKKSRDDNYYYAKKHIDDGVQVIPIIKYTHKANIIKQLLSLNLDYYAVSCIERNKCYSEIDRFLRYLSDNFNIFHRRKIHLLGISNKGILNKFPFYSCNTNTLFTAMFQYGHRYTYSGEIDISLDLESRLKHYAKLEDYLNIRWKEHEYE